MASSSLYRRNTYPSSPQLRFHRSLPPPPRSAYAFPKREIDTDINDNPFAYFITPPTPPLSSPNTEQPCVYPASPPTPFLTSSPWSFDSDESDDFDDDEDLSAGIEMAPLIRNAMQSSLPSNAESNNDSRNGEEKLVEYTDFILFEPLPSPSTRSYEGGTSGIGPLLPSPSSSNLHTTSASSHASAPTTSMSTQMEVDTPKPRPRRMAGSSHAPRRWRRSWAAPDWRLGVIFESEDETEDDIEDEHRVKTEPKNKRVLELRDDEDDADASREHLWSAKL